MQLRCIGNITNDLFLYEYPPPFCGCDPNCNVVKYQIRDSEKSELYLSILLAALEKISIEYSLTFSLIGFRYDAPISLSIVTLIINFPQVIYYRSLMYGFTDFLSNYL